MTTSVSDSEYDRLYRVGRIGSAYPDQVLAQSDPSCCGKVLDGFENTVISILYNSFAGCFSNEELEAFDARAKGITPTDLYLRAENRWFVYFTYENGDFRSDRGDGSVGEKYHRKSQA